MSAVLHPLISTPWLFTVGNQTARFVDVPTISSSGDIAVHAGPEFVLAHLSWLSAWVSGYPAMISGQLVACDGYQTAKQRYVFQKAVVRSIAFPTLDSGLQTHWRLDIRLHASEVMLEKASAQPAVPPKFPIHMTCGIFQMSVTGADTTQVSHVDQIVMTRPGVLPTVTFRIPASALLQSNVEGWKKAATTKTCRVCFLGNMQELLVLKFMARVSSILYATGGKYESNQIVRLPVTLSAGMPTLGKP